MKQFILFLFVFAAACSPKTVEKMGDYNELPKNATLENWVGQKVTFVATPCSMEYQHLLKSSLDGTPSYICIESESSGQILAYYEKGKEKNVQIENAQNLRFRVFGTINKISGAGKGGGTHTEYYLDLDNVEL